VRAKAAGVVALKLYPAGATTNSDAGVTDIRKHLPTLEAMQREGLLLLVHGEVTDPAVDLFDREAVFIDRVMQPLRRDLPGLKVVFEHITTREAAQYVADAGPSHRGHHHRAPPALQPQRTVHWRPAPALLLPAGAEARTHRLALVAAVPPSGSPRFFLGTDSAPHAAAEGAVGLRRRLLHRAGRAGAVRRGLRVGRRAGQAGRLCQLPRCRLLRPAAQHRHGHAAARALDLLPETLPFGDALIKPLRAGDTLNWKLTMTPDRVMLLIDADNVSVDVMEQAVRLAAQPATARCTCAAPTAPPKAR
jgi:dihydroorotase